MGTYSESVTVRAADDAASATKAVSEQLLSSRELQQLRGLITNDPFRAIQSLPGVASFNSHFNFRGHPNASNTVARPFSLAEMPVSEVAGAAVKWKEGRPNWTALRKLLAE